MARPASNGSSRSSGSRAALLACVIALGAVPGPARPCGSDYPNVFEETTFDPRVLGDPSVEGSFYDPYVSGYGPSCDACVRKELLADWSAYLPGIRAEDWSKVLFDADLSTIDGLIFFLQGKQGALPAGWDRSSLAAIPREGRERLVSALFLVGLARRVEPFAVEKPSAWWSEAPRAEYDRRLRAAGDPAALQRGGDKALARTSDPFLRQRYAFQLLRLRFHRQGWDDVVAFHVANAAALEGPSASLRWRARYYLAGAYWRTKRFAQANLELARIRAGFPPLAAQTLRDFHPMEESDWQATLALAKSAREKAELWQMVGVTRDAVAAISAIVAIDPSSNLVGLLAVRELNRLELRQQGFSALERVSVQLAEAARTDRPWLFDLISGHIAALRGDLPAARAKLERAARRAPPSNALARAQARASLALALARTWRPGNTGVGEELARAVNEARDPSGRGPGGSASQLLTARRAVRAILAETCRGAGLREEAELLVPTPPPSWWRLPATAPSPWQEARFIQTLLARVSSMRSAFDRFLVEDSGYTRQELELELAQHHLVQGDFAAADRILAAIPGDRPHLGTDPFVMHVVDCHYCDHEKHAGAPWTLRTFVARLAELQRLAGGRGEVAAKAAFELASGLYNVTKAGNARGVLAGSHSATADTRPAERWFKVAYDLSGDRELKARAATMAAKCELARAGKDGEVSSTWYPVLRELSDTAYQKEVLVECGWYRAWAQPR